MLRVEEQEVQAVFENQPLRQPPPDYPAPRPWEDGEEEEVLRARN